MISTFGCINGMVLSGARVMYTMAEENQFLRIAKDLNVKQVPSKALWLQGIWTALLCLSGKYGALLDYVVIAVLIFYVITLIGIFKLRKTEPTMDRPYKAVGYPFLPILYILMASVLSICLLLFKTETTLPGILLVLIGVPVYYIFIKHKKSSI
jgi:APA family basic amino acid/polyamine antiporter